MKVNAEKTVFPPLSEVTLPRVPTKQAAHYLMRQEQTLRTWACRQTYPDPRLRPLNVGGRLAWPVDGIKAVLETA